MESVSPDLFSGNIIKTRIRLARNISGYRFCGNDERTSREIVKKVNRALIKCDTFNLYYVANVSETVLEAMKERNLISKYLTENAVGGAALINADESLSVMINEEDVIREQCFMKGLRLKEAYDRLDGLDDELAKNVDISFHPRWGYLTACPTNLGTGMRASVMLFLPALSESGKIRKVAEEARKAGLTVRGVYGEGSVAEGSIYQISNEVTLGISEYDILKSVEEAVLDICMTERELAKKLYISKEIKTMDRAKRAFGVLTNAVLLSYEEFLSLIAEVKIGAMFGMIDVQDLEALNDLTVKVRPANLCVQYGKELSAFDRDLFRAEVVSKKLLKLREI